MGARTRGLCANWKRAGTRVRCSGGRQRWSRLPGAATQAAARASEQSSAQEFRLCRHRGAKAEHPCCGNDAAPRDGRSVQGLIEAEAGVKRWRGRVPGWCLLQLSAGPQITRQVRDMDCTSIRPITTTSFSRRTTAAFWSPAMAAARGRMAASTASSRAPRAPSHLIRRSRGEFQ